VRFADTSFWVALRLERDRHHPVAANLWASGLGPLATTNLVVGEAWTFFARRAGQHQGVRFLDAINGSPDVLVRRVDEELEDEAWRWLRRHDEREYSFVDATSFALMRRLRIREALAFDGDFAAAGFVEVRP
jgi:predicted nucleic acid-binding protein